MCCLKFVICQATTRRSDKKSRIVGTVMERAYGENVRGFWDDTMKPKRLALFTLIVSMVHLRVVPSD